MRLASIVPLPHWVVGAMIAGALSGAYLGLRWVLDAASWEPHVGLTGRARIGLVVSLLIGYVAWADRYLSVSMFRDLQKMGMRDPQIDLRRDETPALQAPLEVVRRSRVAGGLSAVIGVGLLLWIMERLSLSVRAVLEQPTDAWLAAATLLLFWMIGRSAYFTFRSARFPDHLARRLEIDLIALDRLQPFGRIALRGALVWIVGVSVASLIFLSSDLRPEIAALPLLPIFGATFVIAGIALLLPVRGIQQRVHRMKLEECQKVDAELRLVRDASLGGDAASQERLAGLLAYRRHVEDLPEWPFDTSTPTRFTLYLCIPLVSWFGGAFVERLVSSVLD